jgi:hypothetical protein
VLSVGGEEKWAVDWDIVSDGGEVGAEIEMDCALVTRLVGNLEVDLVLIERLVDLIGLACLAWDAGDLNRRSIGK